MTLRSLLIEALINFWFCIHLFGQRKNYPREVIISPSWYLNKANDHLDQHGHISGPKDSVLEEKCRKVSRKYFLIVILWLWGKILAREAVMEC